LNEVDLSLQSNTGYSISIKAGYSWHFKKYSKDQNYASSEDNAKVNKLGLWMLDNLVPH
jgi:endonuclease YncB( thermonuclease family)